MKEIQLNTKIFGHMNFYNEEGLEKDYTLCIFEDFSGLDFTGEENLISDQLKQLLESYFTKMIWKAYVWIDKEKADQVVFWYLYLPEYQPEKVEVSKTGMVSWIQVDVRKAPMMFQMDLKNGKK